MSVEITIQRSPHDNEHPFVMVSRDLINNISISNDLKMLIIYCLSKPKEWIFRFVDIMKNMHFSERTLYRIIDEGLQHGYISKTQQRFNGKFQTVQYFFSEDPKFKKCSPSAKNRDAENGAIYSNKESYLKEKDFKALEPSEIPKTQASPYLKSLQLSPEATNKLKQFPDEAINYAVASYSKMKDKPKDPIPILISLCKKWLKREAETIESSPASLNKKLQDLYDETPELKFLVKLSGMNFKLEFGDISMIFPYNQENLHEKIIQAICKINYQTQKMQK